MKFSERTFLCALIVVAPQLSREMAIVLWTICIVLAIFASVFMKETTK